MKRRRALRQFGDIFCRAVPDAPDWNAILALANAQLVTPELCDRLDQLGALSGLPVDLQSFLEDVRRRTRERNARLANTLGDALGALNAFGIRPVLLKGCAVWAGPTPERSRIVSDIDLLVRGDEIAAAIDGLSRQGFAIVEDQRHAQFHRSVVLARVSDVGSIDLHQHAPGPASLSAIADPHGDSRPVVFQEGSALLPSAEAQILVAVMHDQLQDGRFWRGGFELRHLLDIAAFAAADVDWERLMRLCPTSNIRLAMLSQLCAAKEIAGARIPDQVIASFWGRLHYQRQRAQYVWPALNAPFHTMGLNKKAWMFLSSRSPGQAKRPGK